MLFASTGYAALEKSYEGNVYQHPFYVGIIGGYGSTTWGQLISKENDDIDQQMMSISTPIKVSEGGAIAGVYMGYEFLPTFALEFSYVHYPNAEVYFDPNSIYSMDETDGSEGFVTHTETISLSGKFMLLIPHLMGLRAFSSVGASAIHRNDSLSERWRVNPTFGVGFNYMLTPRMMAEMGIDYTAGYGESQLSPADNFVPFLYTAFFRLACRFG